MSASAISKPIFEIKTTEGKNNISTHMLSGSGKTLHHLVLWLQAPHQKAVVVFWLLIPAQADQEVLSLDHKKGEVNLRHFPKLIQSMLVVSDR